MQNNDKLKRVAELISEKRRECGKQLKELYERKNKLLIELTDRTIPYNHYLDAKEMLDFTIDLISDAALEGGIWEQAREIVFNVMEGEA